MKRKSLITSAMIAALGIGLLESGPANAQGLGGGPGIMQGPDAGRRAMVLPGFDTDGVVNPIGLQQARQQFAQRGQGMGQGRGRDGRGQGPCGQGTGLGGQGTGVGSQGQGPCGQGMGPGRGAGPRTPGMGPGRGAGPGGQGQSPTTSQGQQ